jgi:hypothetical protein
MLSNLGAVFLSQIFTNPVNASGFHHRGHGCGSNLQDRLIALFPSFEAVLIEKLITASEGRHSLVAVGVTAGPQRGDRLLCKAPAS